MKDNFGREINYLRISVTDRCNLRCRYCMPETGYQNIIPKEQILSFEEIIRLAKAAAEIGISKIRLTGGEPLVRHGIIDLIAGINAIPGIEEIGITTNGILLADMARDLKEAGVSRVNISIDTMKPDKYARITRGGDLNRVLAGIEAAEREGLTPVKLNVVALGGFNDDEFADFIELTRKKPYVVRFIELMPIGHADVGDSYGFIANQEILNRFPELVPADSEKFSVSRDYRLPDGKGKVGLISALSNHFCSSCNKIRLTSDGKIKPCLHSNEEIDMKGPLHLSDGELVKALRTSVNHKVAHHMLNEGAAPIERDMNKIGG